jgi:hypothetical protein
MKALKWLAYISAGIGLFLVILGSVAAVFHLQLLEVRFLASYFEAANSFFLITLMILFYIHSCRNKKE